MVTLDIETWNILAPLTTWVTPRRTLAAQIVAFLLSFGLLGGLTMRGFLFKAVTLDDHWAAKWFQTTLPAYYVFILGYMLTKQMYFAYKMKQLVDKSPEYQRVRTFHLSRRYRQCIRYQLYMAATVIVASACHFVTYLPNRPDPLWTLFKQEMEHLYVFSSPPVAYLGSVFAIMLKDLKLDSIRQTPRKGSKQIKRLESFQENGAKSAIANKEALQMKHAIFSDKMVRFKIEGQEEILYPGGGEDDISEEEIDIYQ
jgi:hypothetical protein